MWDLVSHRSCHATRISWPADPRRDRPQARGRRRTCARGSRRRAEIERPAQFRSASSPAVAAVGSRARRNHCLALPALVVPRSSAAAGVPTAAASMRLLPAAADDDIACRTGRIVRWRLPDVAASGHASPVAFGGTPDDRHPRQRNRRRGRFSPDGAIVSARPLHRPSAVPQLSFPHSFAGAVHECAAERKVRRPRDTAGRLTLPG